jgi:uncharacterized protein (TIGR01777 family)
MPRFSAACDVDVPAHELFAWHERPGAFDRLNPPWDPVRVRARAGGIRDGATITVGVPFGPFEIAWSLVHRDYVAGAQFRDEQARGPFARWSHLHRVEATGADTSRLVDTIDFAAPLGPLGGSLAHPPILARLRALFRYRHEVTRADLARHAAAALPPMRIAITGATGLVGTALDAFLSTGGHAVHRLVRRAPDPARAHPDIRWNPDAGTIDARALEGMDAVIHLAGANVGERWTDAHRRAIRESRVRGTALLAETLARLERRPATFVSASAIGIYGDRGAEVLDETSTLGDGFLADVGRVWESSADAARGAGIRVVHPRIGIVLSARGGALARMLPPFRLGLGGRLGSGRQWMSWIALDDVLGGLLHVLATPTLVGPVNFTAPAPVTNAEFTRVLGRVLSRPAFAFVPEAALSLAFGAEMARAVLLASQRVLPRALEASGFRFRFPALEPALRFELGR